MSEYIGEPIQVHYTEPGSHRNPSLDHIKRNLFEMYGDIKLECVEVKDSYHAPGCGAGHTEIWRARPAENLSGQDIANIE